MFFHVPGQFRKRRRRWRGLAQLAGVTMFTFGFVGICLMIKGDPLPSIDEGSYHYNVHARVKRNTPEAEPTSGIATNETSKNDTSIPGDDPLFPTDLFSLEERRKGALALHILGMISGVRMRGWAKFLKRFF